MRKKLNLTQKFIGFLLLTSVIPLLAVGISSYQVSRKILYKEAIKYTDIIVNQEKDYLNLQLQQIKSLIANISGVNEIIEALDTDDNSFDTYTSLATKARIGYILNGYSNLEGLVSIDIFTMRGVHYHVGDTLNVSKINNNVKYKILVQALQDEQDIVWIGIEDNVNANSKYQKVITAAKIINKTDSKTLETKPVAMLLVNYSPEYIYKLFSAKKPNDKAYLLVIDGQNRIIYHPNRNLLGLPINKALVKLLPDNQGTFIKSIEGQKMLITYSRLKINDWVVLSFVPFDEVVAPTAIIGATTSIVLLLSFLAILQAAWLVSSRIVQPIRKITKKFELFQRESPDWQVPIPVRGSDEIADLTIWFNTFLESMEARELAENALKDSFLRETATLKVVERMRETLELEQIVKVTTFELRQLLKCDRLGIFGFDSEMKVNLVASSSEYQLSFNLASSSELKESDRLIIQSFLNSCQTKHEGKRYLAVKDIKEVNFTDFEFKILEELKIKAYLIIPIFQKYKLWGIIVSYQKTVREWKDVEINLLTHIKTQLEIALQQIELLEQTQRQSTDLEKAKEIAEQANSAKSEFLAHISHELRTPLNAILGFSEIMSKSKNLNLENQEYLNIINRSGKHLLSLINDVLEMSKIEAGHIKLNKNPFDLYYLLDSLQEMLSLKAKAKQLTLVFNRSPQLPQYIETDESKLRQILLNLLGNAIKFTEKGQITLSIKIQEQLTDNLLVHLFFEVQDTGCGIKPEDLEYLFKAFVQTEKGKQSQEGTGLGLLISKKYVSLMGGNITVESTLERGSTFTFDIWVTKTEAIDIAYNTKPLKVMGIAANQQNYRLLIVDDKWENTYLLMQILTPLGFEVFTAKDGQEGLAVWETSKPDLILMDMRMPVMNGYETTRQIRAKELANITSSAHTKIIALTASAFEETRSDVEAAGCDDFMRKPVQQELLLQKLKEHLGINYIYEESQTTKQLEKTDLVAIAEESIPLENHLLSMDKDWISQIHQAAIQGHDENIFKLIEKIPENNSSLALTLKNWAWDFQFDKIINLIELYEKIS